MGKSPSNTFCVTAPYCYAHGLDTRIMRYLVILVLCRCATIMTQALTHIAKNTCVRIMNIGLSILYEA